MAQDGNMKDPQGGIGGQKWLIVAGRDQRERSGSGFKFTWTCSNTWAATTFAVPWLDCAVVIAGLVAAWVANLSIMCGPWQSSRSMGALLFVRSRLRPGRNSE